MEGVCFGKKGINFFGIEGRTSKEQEQRRKASIIRKGTQNA